MGRLVWKSARMGSGRTSLLRPRTETLRTAVVGQRSEELVLERYRVCRRLENHLRELERDLHEPMNLENFVLYPRAIELEDQLWDARVPAHSGN